MSDLDYVALARTIRLLALKAGEATEAVRGQGDLEISRKDDQSPVSEADLAADRIIVEGLQATCPDIALVSEERAETHGAAPDRFFLIDPLDGTKEFITGSGEYTVNIALIENGAPVLGVVFAPAINRLFWTPDRQRAAIENDNFSNPDEAKTISVRPVPAKGLIAVSSRSHGNSATDNYLANYTIAGTTQAGSSLKLCLLAAGEADIYPRLARTMEWDIGAGHAVLAAAGGQVIASNGNRLRYGKPGFDNDSFVAASGEITIHPWTMP